MRIRQGRVSNSISTFKREYLNKFELFDCYDIYQPVVLFGMYDDSDYAAFQRYENKIVVVWCGSDSLMISKARENILRSKTAVHIVKSNFMSYDLQQHNIPHSILPVSWQSFNLSSVPRGNFIFHYGLGKAYGIQYIPEIERRTGLPVVMTSSRTFTKDKLYEMYKRCFIGLRLTNHDGLPNTVLELGMMGRRCIYNGGLPNAIKWKGIDDIIDSILQEYSKRTYPDMFDIERSVKDYINIGDSWLHV